jgi:hypothetical protein
MAMQLSVEMRMTDHYMAFAVGTPITERPPHRTGYANTGGCKSRRTGLQPCIQPIIRTYYHVRLRSTISSSHAATAAAVSP